GRIVAWEDLNRQGEQYGGGDGSGVYEDRQKRELSIMQLIDEEEIEAQRTPKGGWNRSALANWGVPWPAPSGWKRAIIEYGIPYQATLNTIPRRGRNLNRACVSLYAGTVAHQ